MQPGGLGVGQLGACSLVAAELEETPKMGIRAQVKLGGRGLLVLTQHPGLPLPLSCSRVTAEGPRREGKRSLGLAL